MLSIDIRALLTRGQQPRAGEGFSLELAFQAGPGVTVLFGPSGSGKSSTLAAIAGIIKPLAGRIAIDDQVLFDHNAGINLPIQQRNIGMVFQQLALFEHLTVLENVCYGLHQLPRAARQQRAREMLARFEIEPLAGQRPAHLSGGERQRVALARTLVTNPRALLLDEPLSALDAATKAIIIGDLRKLANSLTIPILLVTHDRGEATALGQQLLVFEAGRIVTRGAPLAVLGAPRSLSVANLTGIENILAGHIERVDAERGTMSVKVGSITIDVPFSGQPVGEAVNIGISARDILLALEKPVATSARNLVIGRISEMQAQDFNFMIKVDCGVELITLVTRQAANELALAIDKTVWLAFKAHSCYLLA